MPATVIDQQAAFIEELTGALDAGAAVPAAPVNPFSPAGPADGRQADGGQAEGRAAAGRAGFGPGSARGGRTADAHVRVAGPGPVRTGMASSPSRPGAEKPLARYVPAGSYAEAVVLAGADASAGVQSQGDPRPVLLRLTSPAFGASVDGVASSSDIEGCTLTGAAIGDLSSEKVYVRLQTLACAGEAPESVIETPVAGFVAGGGQAGVRGPVVSREGALVQKAFFSGLFSGTRREREPGVPAQGAARRRRHGHVREHRHSTTSAAPGSARAPAARASRSATTSSAAPNSTSRSSSSPRARRSRSCSSKGRGWTAGRTRRRGTPDEGI